MRSKEEANDYRYFPCPDLLPIEIDDSFIERIRAELPELPEQRQARFITDYSLSDYDANLLANDRFVANYFEAVVKDCKDAKLAANWVISELNAKLNKDEIAISQSPVAADALALLIKRIKDDTISGKIAKQVFEAMWAGEGSADEIIEAKGLKQMSDTGELEAMIDEVLANNPDQVANYQAAEADKRKKMIGFFVGQIMKASKGQANPGMVNKLLMQKLNG
jgi:aspartyl-tRNA(Asn)/glutamyl-tRNA(Gln) amidotransferase subunit B